MGERKSARMALFTVYSPTETAVYVTYFLLPIEYLISKIQNQMRSSLSVESLLLSLAASSVLVLSESRNVSLSAGINSDRYMLSSSVLWS